MRPILTVLAFAAMGLAQTAPDPARLEVTTAGNSLSYKLINLSPYRVVEFEVYTQFTSGGFEALGCGVKAEVKSPKDLVLPGTCQLPRDAKTGQPVKFEAKIVQVDFENGITWTPKSTKPGKQ
ncbi:MAG TPA: hypothetical protein VJN43_08950 [Bryobacteraceae bacterium]|nr:hypothetical protein [Bryobacteraceae bacterium]